MAATAVAVSPAARVARLLLRIRSGRVVSPPAPGMTVEDVRTLGSTKMSTTESLRRALLLQNALGRLDSVPGTESFHDPAMEPAPAAQVPAWAPAAGRKHLALLQSAHSTVASAALAALAAGARAPMSSCVILGGQGQGGAGSSGGAGGGVDASVELMASWLTSADAGCDPMAENCVPDILSAHIVTAPRKRPWDAAGDADALGDAGDLLADAAFKVRKLHADARPGPLSPTQSRDVLSVLMQTC